MKERRAHQKASRSSQRLCPVTFEPGTTSERRQRRGETPACGQFNEPVVGCTIRMGRGSGGCLEQGMQTGRRNICDHVTRSEVDFRQKHQRFHLFLLAKIIQLIS